MKAKVKSSLSSSSTIIFFAIYLLVVVRLWIMPLGSSFWLDETLTFWNVKSGVFEAIKRSAECPGFFQIYMAITALSGKLFGLSESGLRLPSLVASIFSSYLMFLLGRRFSNTETGILAAILFAVMPEIAVEASNARPYALMLLCALNAMWQLTCFHDSGHWRNAAGYILSAALMAYIHYISLPFILVTSLYSFSQLSLKDVPMRHKTAMMHFLLIALILPLCYIILVLGKDSPAQSFTGSPDITQFVLAIFTSNIIVSLCLVLTAKAILSDRVVNFFPITNKQIDYLLLYWFLIPITFAFSVSIITDYKIFETRYYLLSYPALALLLAGLIQKISLGISRHGVLLSICLYTVIITGGKDFCPLIHHEDWRGALSAVNVLIERVEVPLLINSGLIETSQPGWEAHTTDHHLLSPLAAYPVRGQVISLPYELNNQSQAYLEKIILQKTLLLNGFIVVHRGKTNSVNKWIEKKVIFHGLQSVKIGNFQGVSVTLYRQKSSTGTRAGYSGRSQSTCALIDSNETV